MMPGDLVIHQPGVRPFDVEGSPLRFGVANDGRAYAVAADLAKRFDYASTQKALQVVEDDEKGLTNLVTPGGTQQVWVIYEDGILELIFRSGKPEARRFKKRVKAILKEIQETGRYEAESIVDDLSALEVQTQRTMQAIAIAKEERVLRRQAEAKVVELEPDAARARQTMDAHGLALVGTVAKRFGIKVTALRDFMHSQKLLIKGGSRHNEPYAEHVKAGHFEVKTTLVDADPDLPPISRSTTFVTPKGEALIWKRLYEAGLARSREMPGKQLELISA